MSNQDKTVCVIGAGLSGLVAVKSLSDSGFNVTCFETNPNVGGKWHKDNKDPIPRSTITNLPKYMSCYSDFPLPEKYPLFISADQYAKYFEMYAENFCLLNHINFQHEVLLAEPLQNQDNSDSDATRWKIKYINNVTSETKFQEFDFLVVSSGFYSVPYIPERTQSALNGFKGRIMHSIEYKNAEEFKDKTVVVCGLGNTGGDVAVEVSRFAKKTIIATSHGCLVLGRFISNGAITMNAGLMRIAGYLPSFVVNPLRNFFTKKVSNHVADINQWNLAPKLLGSFIINDEILHQIAFGKVVKRSGVGKVEGNTIYFDDGKNVENVDIVILCTGYSRKFSFLNESIVHTERNGKFVPLYKGIFPINFRKSLAFVGMYSIKNTFTLTSEIQSRYIAEIFQGNINLPTKNEMREEIDQYVKNMDAKYGEWKELNTILEPWKYYNELMGEIGCRPSLFYILLTDPVLFWHLSTRYNFHEFRLVGPNKWNGAREAIINQHESINRFFTE